MSRPGQGSGWIGAEVRIPAGDEEAVVAAFGEAGCLGVQSCSSTTRRGVPRVTLQAWFGGRQGVASVARRAGSCLRAAGLPSSVRARVRRVADGHWVEKWQRTLKAMPIGTRILALPESCRPPARTQRIVIRIPFGQAFGTGEHASTRLCLRLLERHLRPGDRVLDLGTGTAILAVAAAHLGARSVLAVDDDPIAVRVARDTLRRNRMARRVDLRCADASQALEAARFDLVLVNIGATVIARVMPRLARTLAPGGRAVLAGLLTDDESSLVRAAGDAGLVVGERIRRRPWSALLVRRLPR